jgi:diguanylate cyclase (GGDEF)-like protein
MWLKLKEYSTSNVDFSVVDDIPNSLKYHLESHFWAKYLSLLAEKYQMEVQAILQKIAWDKMYASSLDCMFTKHSKNKDLRLKLSKAEKDPLTWLQGRSAYDYAIQIRAKNVGKNQRETDGIESWLLVIDCDNFKMVNDTHGHAAGDHALKEVVRIMEKNTREGDFIARLWGDEFAIILDACSERAAWTVCEKLRNAVSWNIHYDDWWERVTLWITLSIGVSPITDDSKSTEKCADNAMYRAKAYEKAWPKWNDVFIFSPKTDNMRQNPYVSH